jgi:hypothetical protein
MSERRWNLAFGELCDRLFICQLKELFIPEHREVYTRQIADIVHDLDLLCEEKNLGINGQFILAVGNIMLMNRLIWQHEANYRNGIEEGNDLRLTHSLNTLRTQCYSLTSQLVGDRGEFKKDTLIPHPQWIPSLLQ